MMERICFRIDDISRDILEKIANKKETTVSEVIRQYINRGIKLSGELT